MQSILYNVTSYKSFVNKVYDLVGQPSYFTWFMTRNNLLKQKKMY